MLKVRDVTNDGIRVITAIDLLLIQVKDSSTDSLSRPEVSVCGICKAM
jgi:hypothetical protein